MVEVRKLTPGDVVDYRTIRLAALQGAPEAFGSTYAVEAKRLLSHFEERLGTSTTFAAYDGTDIVGMVGFFVDPGPKECHKGFLVGMYVRPEVRGQGVGKALIRALLDHASGVVEQVLLAVIAGNAPALGLYERFGFTTYGVEPRSMKAAAGYSDEILMVAFLRPS